MDLSTGAACFSGFDSYLSQVIGWGFALKPKQYAAELKKIEQFYASFQHARVDIELCPYAGTDLAVFLSERGYGITEFNNVFAFNLMDYSPVDLNWGDLIIKQLSAPQFEEWATQMAIGFEYPPIKEQFVRYASANNVLVFGVYDHTHLIAGASLAMHGEVCDLAVTSTLPQYRGKGLQKKLVSLRLNEAKKRGLRIATVTTVPGTVSDLNVQKVGFSCAYTRIKFTKLAL